MNDSHSINNDDSGVLALNSSPAGNENVDTVNEVLLATNQVTSHETIMSVFLKQNKFAGACYLTNNENLLYLNSMIDEGPQYYYMDVLYNKMHPTVIITSSSCSSTFKKHILFLINNDTSNSVSFQTLSTKYFNYETCKNRILEMTVSIERNDEMQSSDFEQYVLSSINIADEELVSAVGALIYYTENVKYSMPKIIVRDIQLLKLDNINLVNEETLLHLQVFNPVDHPSGFKWRKRSQNEGLSIYNLLEKYCGKISLSHLKLFLSRPLSDVNILKERYDVIKFVNDPENYQVVDNIKRYLHSLSTLPVLLSNIGVPSLRGVHWKVIYKNIHFAALVGEMCKSHADKVSYFQKVAELLKGEIYALANFIYKTIDFDAMENLDKFVIKYGVKKELDDAKTKFLILPKTIQTILPYEFNTVPEYIEKMHVVYIPEIKFLLQIPFWKENLTDEELHLPNLELKFTASKVAYYKSKRCKEMDELLGDPQLEIMEEESEIILELLHCIGENLPILIKLIKKLMELDCILALASLAKEHNYTMPNISEEPILKLINARHPLLSIKITDFISNDFISDKCSNIKILCGSNSSGKTVYLKQIGLLAYMVHIGSFIPALEADVSVLNNIHFVVRKCDSIATKSSSFFSELRNLHVILANADSSSLVLIDELGRGTCEMSAVALVTSLVNYFSEMPDSKRPHVILATYHELNKYKLNPAPSLKYLGTDLLYENDEITFLYKVIEGVKHSHFTFEVASACGSTVRTINTAKEVLTALKGGESMYPYTLKRIVRWEKYQMFVRRFVSIDMGKPHYLEKLKKKIKATFVSK